jgi:hypothetical protein
MKMRKRRNNFVPSRDLLEAAARLGKNSDAAVSKVMRSGDERRAIKEEQYKAAMQQKRDTASPR